MKIAIFDKESKYIGEYEIIVGGSLTKDYALKEALKCAVEDGLIKEDEMKQYSCRVVEE